MKNIFSPEKNESIPSLICMNGTELNDDMVSDNKENYP